MICFDLRIYSKINFLEFELESYGKFKNYIALLGMT